MYHVEIQLSEIVVHHRSILLRSTQCCSSDVAQCAVICVTVERRGETEENPGQKGNACSIHVMFMHLQL